MLRCASNQKKYAIVVAVLGLLIKIAVTVALVKVVVEKDDDDAAGEEKGAGSDSGKEEGGADKSSWTDGKRYEVRCSMRSNVYALEEPQTGERLFEATFERACFILSFCPAAPSFASTLLRAQAGKSDS
jgi:hypothetical protein